MQLRPHQVRTIRRLRASTCGTVYIPTGGGKTRCMIEDLRTRLTDKIGKITVVVAPRIMLALQLSNEFDSALTDTKYIIGHVHTGETDDWCSTDKDEIRHFLQGAVNFGNNPILFCTYHSLHKILEAGIVCDHIYYDEAHNSTQRNFFPTVASIRSDVKFFFTATPKNSSKHARGMNNEDVYGQNIITVQAQELLECGAIIPPTVQVHSIETVRTKKEMADIDADTIVRVVDKGNAEKVLVAAPSARIINRMIAHTDLFMNLKARGYTVLRITYKHGAFVDARKVNRKQFFSILHEMGADKNAKFILFHYSILSEGINVAGLTNVILLRNLGVVEMAQTIGRVIRLDSDDARGISSGTLKPTSYANYRKPTGYVTVPVYTNHNKNTAKRLQSTVNTIFDEGKPATSWI